MCIYIYIYIYIYICIHIEREERSKDRYLIVDFVHVLPEETAKQKSSKTLEDESTFQALLSGLMSAEKSHLIKTIFQ